MCYWLVYFVIIFFFKQKTAYEMRISDWSQTCALPIWNGIQLGCRVPGGQGLRRRGAGSANPGQTGTSRHILHRVEEVGRAAPDEAIGRASCRERVCQYV